MVAAVRHVGYVVASGDPRIVSEQTDMLATGEVREIPFGSAARPRNRHARSGGHIGPI